MGYTVEITRTKTGEKSRNYYEDIEEVRRIMKNCVDWNRDNTDDRSTVRVLYKGKEIDRVD